MRKSHELIQLEVCERRDFRIDKALANRFYTLSRGFQGERTVYEWFKKYSKQNLFIVKDYWFYHGKNMQIDLLAIINNHWIVVEVKNYYGHFEYRNNECYLNGKLMSDNYFHQLDHRTQRLRHIANELNPSIEVESVMVFIDEHCDVNIQSTPSTKVIQRHQLKLYIESLAKSTAQRDGELSKSKIMKHLDKY